MCHTHIRLLFAQLVRPVGAHSFSGKQACVPPCACVSSHVCLSCTPACCCGGLSCAPPVHVCRACTAVCLLLRLTALGPGGQHSSWLCRLAGALQVFCQASPLRRQGWVCSCHCRTAACCWPLTPVYMYTSICYKLVDSPQDGSGWLPVCAMAHVNVFALTLLFHVTPAPAAGPSVHG